MEKSPSSSPTKLLLGTRVLLRPDQEEKIGALIIPDYAKEYNHRATVIATGPGRPDDPMLVQAGDVVLYSKERVFPFERDGVTYFIVFQDVIHAVLPDVD